MKGEISDINLWPSRVHTHAHTQSEPKWMHDCNLSIWEVKANSKTVTSRPTWAFESLFQNKQKY